MAGLCNGKKLSEGKHLAGAAVSSITVGFLGKLFNLTKTSTVQWKKNGSYTNN